MCSFPICASFLMKCLFPLKEECGRILPGPCNHFSVWVRDSIRMPSLTRPLSGIECLLYLSSLIPCFWKDKENLSLEDDEALWSRAVNVTESLFPPKLPGAPGQEGTWTKRLPRPDHLLWLFPPSCPASLGRNEGSWLTRTGKRPRPSCLLGLGLSCI